MQGLWWDARTWALTPRASPPAPSSENPETSVDESQGGAEMKLHYARYGPQQRSFVCACNGVLPLIHGAQQRPRSRQIEAKTRAISAVSEQRIAKP